MRGGEKQKTPQKTHERPQSEAVKTLDCCLHFLYGPKAWALHQRTSLPERVALGAIAA